jgi:subtilisin family serine protease
MRRRAPARTTGALLVGLGALALAACQPVIPRVHTVVTAPGATTTAPAVSTTVSPTTTTTTTPATTTTTTTAPPPTTSGGAVPACGGVTSGTVGGSAAAADASAGRSVVALVRHNGRLRVERHLAGSRAGARALARQLRSQSGVVEADVDQPVHLQDVGPDPLRSGQWALDRIPYEATWSATPGGDGTGVTVAVVDTGVRRTHQDLDDGRVLTGCDFSDPNGGDGGNDQNGHGTFVAGIIAAEPDNAVGISGAAPGVHVQPVRVLDASGSGYYSQIVEGITWATDNGANVINLSLGGTAASTLLQAAVQYAVDHGVTVVMAAGNCANNVASCGSVNPPMYPAAYAASIPGAIAVGATTQSDGIASFSSHGGYVDLAAPGVSIESTEGTGDTTFAVGNGTSFASPYVAAAAAILREVCPSDTPAQLRSRLEATAQDLGAPGRDDWFGTGLVRPDLAVAAC